MNSSLEPPRTVVFALCGSFCTFETVLPQIIRLRACGWEVLPMLSYAASALDTRFGRAADWKQRLEEATGHRPLEDLREAEPLGPKHMAQALVIAPCTGTTMALLAAGISATPVTLAAKSMLRGGRPVVIGVSTNDGLSGSVGALAALCSNFFFGQGPWTPWQMYAWGLVGYLGGVLADHGVLGRRGALYAWGFLSALMYGAILNGYYVLGFVRPLTWQSVVAAYAAGAPLDVVHGIATAGFLAVIWLPWGRAIRRVVAKYDLRR